MGKDGAAPFTVVRKKNPFQKHKEEELEKKKRAEQEAAALYDSFVASFEADEGGPKAFVRGGTIQPGSSASSAVNSGSSSKKGRYKPSFLPPNMGGAQKPGAKLEEKSVFATNKPDKSKPKAIDKLLEDIKKDNERREERAQARAAGGSSSFDVFPNEERGSFDDGDPHTTNLYVGNLPQDVDEEVLKREFGQFGPIGSVKIMWPRDEEQRRRGRNCGFVAFMDRESAAAARDALHNRDLKGHEIHVGWGKRVPLPAMPIYPPPEGLAAARQQPYAAPAPAPAPGAPWASRPPPGHRAGGGSGFSSVPPPAAAAAAVEAAKERPRDPKHEGIGPDITITLPDARDRFIIDTLADYVAVDGTDFEQAIMERESKNPEYAFLYDLSSPEHAYYRWRLYSLLNGDSLRSWRAAPFVMVKGGPAWIPPPMMGESERTNRTAASRGGAAAKERDRGKPLSDTQRDRFEEMLRRLTMERESVCDGMTFCLDNAESAQEISEVMTEALTIKETPVNLKVARLFLVSDVLHNSTAPIKNASNFRTRLQDGLPGIFESLAECYRACDSRMTQESLRRHVLRVLRVWRGWYIFSDDFLNGLQATFLYIGSQAADQAARNDELEKELEALDDEALDRRCRLSGISTSSGSRLRRIDRLLALDAYLKGGSSTSTEPSSVLSSIAGGGSEDVSDRSRATATDLQRRLGSRTDGLAAPRTKKPRVPKGSVSKWAMMDDDDDMGGGDAGVTDKMFSDDEDAGAAPGAPADATEGHAGSSADEERRQRLRQVEGEMMLLREDLEEQGVSKQEVERRVEQKRTERMSAFDAEAARKRHHGGHGERERHSGRGHHRDRDSPDRDRPSSRRRSRSRSPPARA